MKVILWDVDGTLLDFDAAERAAIRSLFAEYELDECTDEMLARYSDINKSYWQKLERGELTKPEVLLNRYIQFFTEYGIDTSIAAEFNDKYQLRLGDTIVFHDNSLELIKKLKASGKYKQYVVSNGTIAAQTKKLKLSGIGELMDGICLSEEIGIEKPNIGFFDRVFEDIAVDFASEIEEGDWAAPPKLSEIVIVGDSLTSDIRGGMNAQIKTCWYNPERKPIPRIVSENPDAAYKIDWVITDLNQLEEYLEKDAHYITESEISSLFPERPSDCHKGSFGYTALIGGSIEYSGAIRLANMTNSAMRAGSGVATVATPSSICPLIAPQILEATLYPLSDKDGELVFKEEEFAGLCKRYDCIAIGMGIGNSDETRKAVQYLLENYDKKLIIDADGLNAMARLEAEVVRNSKAQIVLTPHLKEFSRLTEMRGLSGLGGGSSVTVGASIGECSFNGESRDALTVEEVKAKPVEAVRYLAHELNATVLLKGPTTYVAGPDGIVLATDRGCAGMATAGSGDVLSGILSAICPNTENMTLAAAGAAYINGAAGELAQSRHSDVTMTSVDTALCVAEVIEATISR